VSSTCFEHPSVRPQEDLYMQFYCISFMHPYNQSGRWQDVLDIPSCVFKIFMRSWHKRYRKSRHNMEIVSVCMFHLLQYSTVFVLHRIWGVSYKFVLSVLNHCRSQRIYDGTFHIPPIERQGCKTPLCL